jgi:hypothetical protein
MEVAAVDWIRQVGIFRLTGSRFFGTERPDSDWDYYGPDHWMIRAYLVLCGFSEVKRPIEEGSDLRATYLNAKRKMHVQLRGRPDLRDEIQQAMKELDIGPLLENKVNAKKIWKFGYRLKGQT